MRIAERTIGISNKKLKELLSIPDDATISSFEKDGYGSWHINIITAGELFIGDYKITIQRDDDEHQNIRRLAHHHLETLAYKGEGAK